MADPTITDTLIEQMAEAAFEPLVAAFPHITSGDFPPDAHFALHAALRTAAETWVMYNDNDTTEGEFAVFQVGDKWWYADAEDTNRNLTGSFNTKDEAIEAARADATD